MSLFKILRRSPEQQAAIQQKRAQKEQRKAEIAAQPKYGHELRPLTISQKGVTVTVYALAVTYQRETERNRPPFFPNIHAIARYGFSKTQAKTNYVKGVLQAIAKNPKNQDFRWASLVDNSTGFATKYSIQPDEYHDADYMLGPIATCVLISNEDLQKLKKLKSEKQQSISLKDELEEVFAKQLTPEEHAARQAAYAAYKEQEAKMGVLEVLGRLAAGAGGF